MGDNNEKRNEKKIIVKENTFWKVAAWNTRKNIEL
jgi:hypothetical protein